MEEVTHHSILALVPSCSEKDIRDEKGAEGGAEVTTRKEARVGEKGSRPGEP